MSEHMPVAPRCHEEGTNDCSSSGVSPVEAFLFAVSLVGAYFTVKEIIGKKSEKKKRREEEQKRTENVPVVSPSSVAFAVSVGHVTSRPACCCTLRKKR